MRTSNNKPTTDHVQASACEHLDGAPLAHFCRCGSFSRRFLYRIDSGTVAEERVA